MAKAGWTADTHSCECNGQWCTLVGDFIAFVSSVSTVSFSISLLAHSSCMQYWDSARNVGEFLWYSHGIGNENGAFFFFFFCFFVFFLRDARHAADSDGRRNAGAQVLERVPMVPWHPYHSGPALHCRVPCRSERC